MIRLDRPVIVEGKYDKSKLKSIFDAVVLTTAGFGIFSDKERLALLRRVAGEKGVIVLTDSDAAGFRIRGYLKGALGSGKVVNVYIPDVLGKERRKPRPSSEGKLGVEGMQAQVLIEAFEKAGVLCGEGDPPREKTLCKADFYALGLTGAPDSRARRAALLALLDLPAHMSANALLELLDGAYTPKELAVLLEKCAAPQ